MSYFMQGNENKIELKKIYFYINRGDFTLKYQSNGIFSFHARKRDKTFNILDFDVFLTENNDHTIGQNLMKF